MMNPRKRRAILVGTMTAMLAIASVWSAGWMMRQRESAQRAAEDLAACERLAHRIESLRREPTVASDEAMGVQELGQRITTAARRARLGDRRPSRVDPQSPRRVSDSPYLRRPTAIAMEDVSLPQAAAFLYHLTEGSQLRARDLRLRAPRGGSDRKTWDMDVTLTYLVYEPVGDG